MYFVSLLASNYLSISADERIRTALSFDLGRMEHLNGDGVLNHGA